VSATHDNYIKKQLHYRDVCFRPLTSTRAASNGESKGFKATLRRACLLYTTIISKNCFIVVIFACFRQLTLHGPLAVANPKGSKRTQERQAHRPLLLYQNPASSSQCSFSTVAPPRQPATASQKDSKRTRYPRNRRQKQLYQSSASSSRCSFVFSCCRHSAGRQRRIKKNQSGFADGAFADYDDYIEFQFHRCAVCSFSNAVFNRRAGSCESKKAKTGSQTARPPTTTIISSFGFIAAVFVRFRTLSSTGEPAVASQKKPKRTRKRRVRRP